MAQSKYPPHLYTLELHFGEFLPEFYRHFPSADSAGHHLRALMHRMNEAEGRCLTKICLWHKGQLQSTYYPNKPTPKPTPVAITPTGVKQYAGYGRYFEAPKAPKPPAGPKQPLASVLGLNIPRAIPKSELPITKI